MQKPGATTTPGFCFLQRRTDRKTGYKNHRYYNQSPLRSPTTIYVHVQESVTSASRRLFYALAGPYSHVQVAAVFVDFAKQ